MFGTQIKRVIRSGWVNFWRNGYVSLASVLVMTVTLSVIAAIIFTSALLSSTLENIKNKVDVNVYFVTTAPEAQILTLKTRLESLPEVAGVEYVSAEQSLKDFKDRHANDQYTIQALGELDSNPLGAVLNIKAKDPSQYQGIADYLNSNNDLTANGSPIIDKINYGQNKNAIDTLSKIIDSSHKLGLLLTIFFAFISVLITFNTIRLAIHMSRDEISVMRLVGASHMHIRGPFVIEGLLYGVVSAILTMVFLYPVAYWVGPVSENLTAGDVNLFGYYLHNFIEIFALLFLSGLAIGALSSYLAVKRYLKI